MTKNKQLLSAEQYTESYRNMLLLRRFEEKAGQLYGLGKIGGFCHLYIGQEPVAVSTYLAKDKCDSVVTSYRCHGHTILSGVAPRQVMAELTGKKSGCSGGKGGSMHMFNKEGKFFGGHGIVGAQVPIGTGIAFAEKYRESNNISITFMGDGAINQGQVYEAFNMAALWGLPSLYIIENNVYSMGTSVERSTAMTQLHRKGESFGIEGVSVDASDFDALYKTISDGINMVREQQKPFIIEAKTYRYRGHSMSDPAKYRTREEVDSYRQQDPVNVMKEMLIRKKYASEAQIKKIADEVKDIVTDAAEFAVSEEEPAIDELTTDIYCN